MLVLNQGEMNSIETAIQIDHDNKECIVVTRSSDTAFASGVASKWFGKGYVVTLQTNDSFFKYYESSLNSEW